MNRKRNFKTGQGRDTAQIQRQILNNLLRGISVIDFFYYYCKWIFYKNIIMKTIFKILLITSFTLFT